MKKTEPVFDKYLSIEQQKENSEIVKPKFRNLEAWN